MCNVILYHTFTYYIVHLYCSIRAEALLIISIIFIFYLDSSDIFPASISWNKRPTRRDMIKAFLLFASHKVPFIHSICRWYCCDGSRRRSDEKEKKSKDEHKKKTVSYNWYCFFWQFTCIKYNYQYYTFFSRFSLSGLAYSIQSTVNVKRREREKSFD